MKVENLLNKKPTILSFKSLCASPGLVVRGKLTNKRFVFKSRDPILLFISKQIVFQKGTLIWNFLDTLIASDKIKLVFI